MANRRRDFRGCLRPMARPAVVYPVNAAGTGAGLEIVPRSTVLAMAVALRAAGCFHRRQPYHSVVLRQAICSAHPGVVRHRPWSFMVPRCADSRDTARCVRTCVLRCALRQSRSRFLENALGLGFFAGRDRFLFSASGSTLLPHDYAAADRITSSRLISSARTVSAERVLIPAIAPRHLNSRSN